MYLNKLAITGFKSFPEKVEFTFSSGITVAMGPNGCGKSNIMDAVRWVLGSQSPRLLRGSQMDELIFSGTAKRRAMNYAEVSLSLAEASDYLPLEYDELVITRRMYRSGEGEYYINKNPCRLRDITDLFLDTGIGTETYSLIGQGRVEQLINARPEDHREIFEEAARIHKYRRRKKETLSKLEEAAQNLLRVEDLLLELQNQQESLAEKVSVAKRYCFLQDRLREVEKKILARQWLVNHNNREKIQGELAELNKLLYEQESGRLSYANRLEENSRQVQREKEILEAEQALLEENEKRAQQLERSLVVVREQKNFSREKRSFKENALKEIWERTSGLDKTLKQNEDELQKLEQEQKEQGERAAALKEQLKQLQDKGGLAALESLRRQLAVTTSRLATLDQFIVEKERHCLEIRETVDDLQERIKKITAERDLSREKKEQNAALQERLRWDEARCAGEKSALTKGYGELAQKAEGFHVVLQDLEKERESKRTRIGYLRENVENLSYYGGGVKAVMQARTGKEALSGIYGPVADLINVPPNLEKAVEVALGGAVQYLVTADDQAARRAIIYLKENKAGRATFLPLNLLRPPMRREMPAQDEEGLLGVASTLVEAPEPFRKAIAYLLGGVLVLSNLEAALKFARVNKGGWKLVTLDGEVINPGGSISGGYQPRESPGLLQRRRELQNMEKELISQEQAIALARTALQDAIKEREQIKLKLDAAVLAAGELEKTGRKLQAEGDQFARELQLLTSEQQRLEQEQEKWQLRLNAILAEVNQARTEREGLEAEMTGLKAEESLLGERVRQSETVSRNIENELVELRIRFSAIQEKESALREQQRRHLQEKSGLHGLAADLAAEKEMLQEDWERFSLEETELASRLTEAGTELKRRKTSLLALREQIDSLEAQKTGLTAELEKLAKQMERYNRRCQQLQLELVKLDEARRYLDEQLREKYKLEPLQDQAVLEEKGSSNESSGELAVLREQCSAEIASLGTVNTAVIGEYERLQERITFLQAQRQDLLAGEKGIKKVLADLDRYMQEQFIQTLTAVARSFNDVFQKLFNGGQALLHLTDPDNVLESGIEIIAQPPGKNLKNISLLSGGEKALTAIALLFALLHYRPVPFCILDEIDSSLDESNISRFINYLKSFARDTQFIVISHRRRTMEEADVLYGITMEEEGVSKVISLDLTQKAG